VTSFSDRLFASAAKRRRTKLWVSPIAGSKDNRRKDGISAPPEAMSRPAPSPHGLLRLGADLILVALIMFIGSLVLWIGTPVLCLWAGSWIQGRTGSLSLAVGAMTATLIGAISVLAALLARLSQTYRRIHLARTDIDPGDSVLERVLIVSAGIAIAVFGIWFFFFAGANPVPIGVQI
jgi:hypothetical protein